MSHTGRLASRRWSESNGGAQRRADWRATATAVGGMLSVLLVAAGLFYTNDANRKQQQLGVQGQIAARFSAAIDQIGQEGKDKLSIRLGGIYALQRLMYDSPRDVQTMVEVLCAFVRTHAVRPAMRPATVPRAPADVRAAVTVLARRPGADRSNGSLDLSGTLLGLQDMTLSDSDGHNANLERVDLTGADLSGAELSDARLFNAKLTGARLVGTRLRFADLTNVDLTNADLTDADLSDTQMNSTYLVDANLTGSYFGHSNLFRTYMPGANLSGADLTDVVGLSTEKLASTRVDKETRLPTVMFGPSPAPSSTP